MLELHVESREFFNEKTGLFHKTPAMTLQLEHSLLSLSKWEEKYERPFLGPESRSEQEILDYLVFMALTPMTTQALMGLTADHFDAIRKYLEGSHTATTINDNMSTGGSKIVTSEEIYGWMVALNIPWAAETWNLNRLLTLIRVCNIQQNPDKKKESASEAAQRHQNLNAIRRAELKARQSNASTTSL